MFFVCLIFYLTIVQFHRFSKFPVINLDEEELFPYIIYPFFDSLLQFNLFFERPKIIITDRFTSFYLYIKKFYRHQFYFQS